MGTICKITASGGTHLIASTAFGVCTTAASEGTKQVTLLNNASFDFIEGSTIHVFMRYENTAQSIVSLQINDSNYIRPIQRGGENPTGVYDIRSWRSRSVVSFTLYAGTWYISGEVNDVDHINDLLTRMTAAENRMTTDEGNISSIGNSVDTALNAINLLQQSKVAFEDYSTSGNERATLTRHYLSFVTDSNTGLYVHTFTEFTGNNYFPVCFVVDHTNTPTIANVITARTNAGGMDAVVLKAQRIEGGIAGGYTIVGWLYGIIINSR